MMFEIKIWITTPEEDAKWLCNDTRCWAEKGKRDCCRHCPILINEKNRAKEMENLKERIENIFYQDKTLTHGKMTYDDMYTYRPIEEKISEIFKENPIEKLR